MKSLIKPTQTNKKHRFPKDCFGKNCTYFKVWDMSIDDLCCYCELLKVKCDACDEDYSNHICPLDNKNTKDVDISIKQEDGTELVVSTVLIDEDVLRTRCGLEVKEQE